jgi:hypothetical protein
VDVGGHYLTDDAVALTKWQLPGGVVIPAGGYLLVWASNKNRTNPGAPLHTNFALSTGGDYLAVVAPNGTTILHQYAPQYAPQTADISYGLASDASRTPTATSSAIPPRPRASGRRTRGASGCTPRPSSATSGSTRSRKRSSACRAASSRGPEDAVSSSRATALSSPKYLAVLPS